MTQGIGASAQNQGYELLGAALAKSQQQQEGKMVMQLLQSAASTSTQPQLQANGNLGQNINILV